jgi:hypothetical protein
LGEPWSEETTVTSARIPGDVPAATDRKLREPWPEVFAHLAAEPEFDRAGASDRPVRQPAGDEHRLGSAVGRPTNSRDPQPLLTPPLAHHP